MISLLLLMGCWWTQNPGPAPLVVAEGPVARVERQVAGPVAWMEVDVRAGSAHDPAGQEGLAWLVANLLRQGGAGEQSPQQVEQALYALGTDVDVVVDDEQVSFRAKVLAQDAPQLAGLLGEMLTHPRLDPAVFERLKGQANDWLVTGVFNSDETLGMELFDRWIFEGHPYGHAIRGRTGSLQVMTLDDVRRFIDDRFVRPAVVMGVAGDLAGAPVRAGSDRLSDQLSTLPARLYRDVTPRRVPGVEGRRVLIVEKETDSTGIHFGHPTDLGRDHPDWPAMVVAFTALGEHRQSTGRLYRKLRGARGLNYGDYAYVEVYRQAGWSSDQETGTGRVDNPFYVWIRPTTAANGPFALKAALYEVDRFVAEGLSQEELDRVKRYLSGRLSLWATDPGRRLGWATEAALMGWPDPIDTLYPAIEALSLEQVNAAIKAHIDPKNAKIVVVTGDADAFALALAEGTRTPVVYEGAPPPEDPDILAEDEIIAGYAVQAVDVLIHTTEDLFR